ncbi:2TM domain-containing protein [uncultured Flavobacterium sp.]|uniref:2TM domain-containing protein n=1 Tax=uncultured Flavobacterium sp. TaxID=165435 RepID=UPI000AE89FD8|nr:2TM domain-containing protein [uncultured Flavobacterium sp.]
MSNSENKDYRQAEKRVKAIKGFYINLLIYFIANAVLVYINLVYTPDVHWFWYSILSWGIGMLLYGIVVFHGIPFMNSNWEEQKVIALIEKANNKEGSINNILSKQAQHNRAKKRVRALRNFYRHLVAYTVISIILLLLILMGIREYVVFGIAFGWTVGFIIHFFKVFGVSLFLGKSWEEQKLKGLMEEEKKYYK